MTQSSTCKIPDHIVLCGCAPGDVGIQLHFSIKNVIRKHHKIIMYLSWLEAICSFSLLHSEILTFRIFPSRPKSLLSQKRPIQHCPIFITPRCRLWVELGGQGWFKHSQVWWGVDRPPNTTRLPRSCTMVHVALPGLNEKDKDGHASRGREPQRLLVGHKGNSSFPEKNCKCTSRCGHGQKSREREREASGLLGKLVLPTSDL